MPRAFLITHRRYNGTEEFEENVRDYSPERGVRIPEYNSNQPTSDGVSDCGSETSSECPEELYNLTKLAEVSLAAAAGTLTHPNSLYHRPVSPRWTPSYRTVPEASSTLRQNLHINENPDLSLRERTRLFFERIETEREILETRNRRSCLRSPQLCDEDSRKSPIEEKSNSSSRRLSLEQIDGSLASKSDDNEEHECPDCGKKYSTSSNLARHRQTHRSLGDKKARRCPHCDKVYVSMPAFSMHVRTHNQGCKCHYCGKCFSRPWLLQGHIRTHTGEKPFKCTICNKAFADKSNLRAHVQTHSNTKPHVCGRCGKAFALKSYLYKHEESSCMRAHHRAVSEKKEDIINSGKTPNPGPTSSPISVIVPRPGAIETSPVAFSSIIRHTKTNQSVPLTSPLPKRQCKEKEDFSEERTQPEIISRMVIRTSVISSNPEHVPGRHLPAKTSSKFDFSDPSRPSAFSRPIGMSLNLAIA